MKIRPPVGVFVALAWLVLACAACDIRFIAEPVLFCVVDGDTIEVPGDTTGIRCAPIDDVPVDTLTGGTG